jgi:hypothetical protein
MYCPHCLANRRERLTRCPACSVLLVPGAAPAGPEIEGFPKMVCVLDTNDNFALASACAALDQAGIVFDVVPVSDVPEALKTQEPKWWISPSRILVSEKDEPEAREMTEPFQRVIEGDAADEQAAQGRDGVSRTGVLDRLFLPHPTAVQRFGCSLLFAPVGLIGLTILVMSHRDRSFFGIFVAWGLMATAIIGIVRCYR